MTITVRAMRGDDVDAADRVFRRAFGTFFGLKEPMSFRGDAELVRTRFATDPASAFVAEAGGRIVGSVHAMDWGSVAALGPVAVDPDYWGRGIARELMPPILELFARRGVTLAGLFTHPHSPKHIRLYERFGFEVGSLTAVMAKEVAAREGQAEDLELLSALPASARREALLGCRTVAASLYDGLDLGREIEAVVERKLGDCLLLRERGGPPRTAAIAGFAVCHHGAGSEAIAGTLYVKFAAVRKAAEADFAELLKGCERLAAALGAGRVVAGVNTGRRRAYLVMRAAGYRTTMNGVAMHRPDQPGYDRPEIFAIDDLR